MRGVRAKLNLMLVLLIVVFLITSSFANNDFTDDSSNDNLVADKSDLSETSSDSSVDASFKEKSTQNSENSCVAVDEKCDGLDNDCDGLIDEDIADISCGDSDQGTCQFGTRKCEGGGWSICMGAVNSDKETCNGLDDDCDGLIDEDLTKDCGTDEGVCTTGVSICSNGEWQSCSGKQPDEEICDDLDNNCDGRIDEGCANACNDGERKPCAIGHGCGYNECVNGHWSSCVFDNKNRMGEDENSYDKDDDKNNKDKVKSKSLESSGSASKTLIEICDGLDNDCDGLIDEDLEKTCGETNEGACSFGKQVCENGEWSICQGLIEPDIELCDNIDNDCDGRSDESLYEETDYGLRQCIGGEWVGELIHVTNELPYPVVFYVIEDDTGNGHGVENISIITVNPGETISTYVIIIPPDESGYPFYQFDSDEFDFQLTAPNNDLEIELSYGNPDDVIINDNHIILTRPTDTNSDYNTDETSEETPNNPDDSDDSNEISDDKVMIEYDPVRPLLDCVEPSTATGMASDALPLYIAHFSYINENNDVIEIPLGDKNKFSPLPANRNQPIEFYPGKSSNIPGSDFSVAFSDKIVWSLTGPDGKERTITASLSSKSCIECVDKDNDGYFSGDELCDNFDCDDTNASINPAIIEICDNIDNDCDGKIDEGVCSPVCQPEAEVCDGLDNDCDNEIDEICDCVNGEQRECGLELGVCQKGIQTCMQGSWLECEGSINPALEICDGLDNDCDGTIDNGCNCIDGQTQQCGLGIGVCGFAEQTCVDGIWAECLATLPSSELCDNLDNDCDGEIDEDLEKTCGEDQGSCEFGISTCVAGEWQNCVGNIVPITEICDNLDNDCDGFTDEGCDTKKSSSSSQSPTSPEPELVVQTVDPITEVSNAASPQPQERDWSVQQSQNSHSCMPNVVLKEVDVPKKINILDTKFNVIVEVSNLGNCDAYDIPVNIDVESDWESEDAFIDHLSAGDFEIVVFTVERELCNQDESHVELPDEFIDLAIDVDDDRFFEQIPMDIPIFSTAIDPDSVLKNKLDICFYINQKNREDLEIEFELSDREDDIFFDFITPIKTEDKVIIKKVSYNIRVPEQKPYEMRSYLFGGGKLFKSNYLIAEDESKVDMSDANARKYLIDFVAILKKIGGIFS